MKGMIFRFLLVAIMMPNVLNASGMVYLKKPTTSVILFLDAVESGDPDYVKLLDIESFKKNNSKMLSRCTIDDIRSNFDKLVFAPIRHKPSPSGDTFEENKYSIVEIIFGYKTADVTIEKYINSKKKLNIKFKLVSSNDRWLIVNMENYIEKYLFEICCDRDDESDH
ncbi:hypothetical protein [Desulfuromonas soudanensis]|nr:hypothetical protein [Desulfuromonas soudanensis]